MEEYTLYLVEWISSLSPMSIYIIFCLVAYLENVIPPVPGDVLIVFGGYLAAEQVVEFVPILMGTTVASVLGFMSMYAIGAHFGDQIAIQRKKFWMMRFFDIKYFDRAKRWMARWGQKVILANRFLAGTRSVISLTAGITKTKAYPTIVSATVSSLIWNTILIGLGYIVHENWQVIGGYLNVYGWIILSMLVLFIGGWILYRRFRKPKKKELKKE
tara:strand:- start:650 stop:1294 length:645 start_codon:yes stop_codon:yes gene_type:complete